MFRDCAISSRIWAGLMLGIRASSSFLIPIREWIKNFLTLFWKEDGIKSDRVKEFIATLWAIWIHQNNVVFRNLKEHPIAILDRKEALLKEQAESSRIREFYFARSGLSMRSLETRSNEGNTQSQGVCTIIVDGAWKRLKQHHPRAGIGWSASVITLKHLRVARRV